MDFMKKTQNLAATLTKEFNCEEINSPSRCDGGDWITLDRRTLRSRISSTRPLTTLPASTLNLVRRTMH